MFKRGAEDWAVVFLLSERWIEGCRAALDRIRKFSSVEGKDRLDYVKSIKVSLALLGRSLTGWSRWVNNPVTMASFSHEELEEMEKQLSSLAESFIEYDMKVTTLGLEKGLTGRKKRAEEKNIRFIT